MIPALLAALLWGSTDAFVGVAARRSSPWHATLALHLASLLVLAPVLVMHRAWQGLSLHGLMLGALAGVLGATGDVMFGRALTTTAMSVGIPLANVVAAAVPVLWLVIQGDRPGTWSLMGMAGAVLATALAAWPAPGKAASTGTGDAVAGGLLFGGMFALLTQTAASQGLTTVFVMRLVGTMVLVPGAGKRATGIPGVTMGRAGAWMGGLAGLTSVGANLLFVTATAGDSRAILPVIAIALSAPAGLLVVNLLQRERLTLHQGLSAGVAMVAIAVFAWPR